MGRRRTETLRVMLIGERAAMGAAATGSRAGPGQLLFRDGSSSAADAQAATDQCAFTNLFKLLDQDLAEVVDDWRDLATSATRELAAVHKHLACQTPSPQDLALLSQCCQQPSLVQQTSFVRQASLPEATSANEVPPWLYQVDPPKGRTNFLGPLADAPIP